MPFGFLLNFNSPAKAILYLTPLNTGECIVELLCKSTDLPLVYRVLYPLVAKLADAEESFGYLDTRTLKKLDDGLS